jgi:hypothetical protein
MDGWPDMVRELLLQREAHLMLDKIEQIQDCQPLRALLTLQAALWLLWDFTFEHVPLIHTVVLPLAQPALLQVQLCLARLAHKQPGSSSSSTEAGDARIRDGTKALFAVELAVRLQVRVVSFVAKTAQSHYRHHAPQPFQAMLWRGLQELQQSDTLVMASLQQLHAAWQLSRDVVSAMRHSPAPTSSSSSSSSVPVRATLQQQQQQPALPALEKEFKFGDLQTYVAAVAQLTCRSSTPAADQDDDATTADGTLAEQQQQQELDAGRHWASLCQLIYINSLSLIHHLIHLDEAQKPPNAAAAAGSGRTSVAASSAAVQLTLQLQLLASDVL